MSVETEQIQSKLKARFRWAKVMRLGIIILVVAFVSGAVAMGVGYYYRGEAANRLASALDSSNSRFEYCRNSPNSKFCDEENDVPSAEDVIASVPGPIGPVGPTGPAGPSGPPPSDEEVQAAVNAYCADGACDADDPTPEQVFAAVAQFCNSDGVCVGPQGARGKTGQPGLDATGAPGKDGSDGADGADGAKGDKGDQGPPPTAQQVATGVADYCASHGGCRGPEGPTGPQGPEGPAGPAGSQGEAGRGIQAISCNGLATATFVVTYSDGTTQEFNCN